jgi:hypothetical protein
MHKTSAVVALILVALAGTAHAQDVTQPAARTARREVSVSLLPMGLGTYTSQPGGRIATADAAFNYGLGLHVGYAVLPGLTVGFAPQVCFNVKPKVQGGNGGQEIDLMARAAYTRQIVESIALFVEVLPGYSLIRPSPGDASTGLVLAFGAGSRMALSERAFATFGLGYQVGFQNLPARDGAGEARARYVRVAIGVGTRF